MIEGFQFAAWPEKLVIPEGLSWDESQKLRHEHYKKGRLESIDWQILAKKLEHSEPKQYEISNATIMNYGVGTVMLRLELIDDSNVPSEFPEIRIAAEKLRTLINEDQEVTFEEFLALGEAYWKAFAERGI